MKSSVSSYSFHQYIKAGKMTQLDTVAKAHELGFDSMEFIDIAGAGDYDLQCENARKIRAEADKYGMTITAYTIGGRLYNEDKEALRAEIERLKGQVDICAILGAPVMRHDVVYQLGNTIESRSFDAMLPTIAASVREITEYAATKGIRTCSENHGYIAQDSDRIERLINAVAHENYGVLVDMGNFLCADENPAVAVSRVAPFAFHVHAKDMIIRNKPINTIAGFETRGSNYLIGVAVGEGDVPVEQCLRVLKKAGYDGIASIEYEGIGDCIEGIKIAKRNLDRYIEALD